MTENRKLTSDMHQALMSHLKQNDYRVGWQISSGTQDPVQLLPEFLGELDAHFDCDSELDRAILDEGEAWLEYIKAGSYFALNEIKSHRDRDAIRDNFSDIMSLMDKITPKFCIFGLNEQDSSSYGYWFCDNITIDDLDTDELVEAVCLYSVEMLLGYYSQKELIQMILDKKLG